MPKLSAVLADRAEATITVAGTPIRVTYRPKVYTEEYEQKLLEASKASPSPSGLDDLHTLICDLVERWDLTDDDDAELPVTREVLAKHSNLPFARAFTQELLRTLSVGEANGRRR